MGGGGQAKYLARIKIYELVKAGDFLGLNEMGKSAVPALKKLLEDGEFWEKCNAIEALGGINCPEAKRLLKSLLRDRDWGVRETAIRLLQGKNIGWLDRELERMAESDPIRNVRDSAKEAIKGRGAIFPPPRKNLPDNFGNRKPVEKGIAGR